MVATVPGALIGYERERSGKPTDVQMDASDSQHSRGNANSFALIKRSW